jgi:hypothetical protein
MPIRSPQVCAWEPSPGRVATGAASSSPTTRSCRAHRIIRFADPRRVALRCDATDGALHERTEKRSAVRQPRVRGSGSPRMVRGREPVPGTMACRPARPSWPDRPSRGTEAPAPHDERPWPGCPARPWAPFGRARHGNRALRKEGREHGAPHFTGGGLATGSAFEDRVRVAAASPSRRGGGGAAPSIRSGKPPRVCHGRPLH